MTEETQNLTLVTQGKLGINLENEPLDYSIILFPSPRIILFPVPSCHNFELV